MNALDEIIFITGTIDTLHGEGTGGVPKLIAGLSNGLLVRGVAPKVSVVCAFSGDLPPQFTLDPRVKVIYVQSFFKHHSSNGLIKRVLFWFYSLPLLMFHLSLRSRQSSIVISCTPAASISILLLRKLVRVSKVLVWENVHFGVYRGAALAVRRVLYRRADLLIVPTKGEADTLRSQGLPARFIPNINYSAPDALTKRLGEPGGRQLLAIGRLVKQKGFDLLFLALAQMNQRFDNWSLTLVGSGPEETVLRELAAQLNILSKVAFVPHSKVLASYYINSDVFLLPSRFEGSPLVLIEAQSFGLPCIAFDCPTGPQEILAHGENGFLIPPGNTAEFADAIELICMDAGLRARMRSAARSASTRFSESSILPRWIDVVRCQP